MTTFRIIVRSVDGGRAGHVGGEPEMWFRTFDVESADLDAYLAQNNNGYRDHTIVGVAKIEKP